jgi:hypothetical protein
MRRWVVGLCIVGGIAIAGPAVARDYFGIEAGYVVPMGTSADFASDGGIVELHWRHMNKGHTAFEIEAAGWRLGLEGAVQDEIARLEGLVRHKNELAQLQGGPGNGFLTAEYGQLEMYSLSVNVLFYPRKGKAFSPFLSFGGGAYNWQVPFRIKFYRTPFFGEQHAWDDPAEGSFYSGVVREEQIDYTKHETTGGLNLGGGITWRLSNHFDIGGTARGHLIFSSGTGNKEEGIDDQDYLDNMSFLVLKGGFNYRF